ncbi:bifunctional 2-C-methyl-D-erythritol 4-phosphate cytidylyltransferase/2-C-methyl-D-erythritol 2,4-cyclodiphosphate synthase [Pseudolabrys sp. FHR47]|uniref:bifunctional 2-C-methyl-D-erythritol 4-phosphate cytidylyltransferase/2-C-methyl-D-erythritol 2,4-cyclodiphosphate synthase n=1 Tax=Pseudolabrys sp. FHR47 TaxID=2562284 RepID=UPI0010BE4E12|nr:bifunctional 2-C-methyl-D-erythritol 4-phosphate cytidylyltransferase/2-C-methyl-D-erythritol 2,4-cyclodiphosphate synthase [Pseudolabrys sp. FHR47]
MAKIAAVIVAAGRGTRAAGSDVPKQFRQVGGEAVLRRCLTAFAGCELIHTIQTVIRPGDEPHYAEAASGLAVAPPVHGGDTRQASVRAGLEALAGEAPDIVLIHDAARPFASPALIARAIEATTETGAAIPGLAVTDTIKSIDGHGYVGETLDRTRLRAVQTPQAFTFAPILEAHRRAAHEGRTDFTDDAAIAEWAGMQVRVFDGESANIKITHPEDFVRAEAMQLSQLSDVRTGTGIDVHAFGPGDHVMIGGVRIAHGQALTGHSDADVGLHALTDAILGALADGDIGSHFPPSDPQWKGAASDRFLKFACERVASRGGRIAHLDLTIVCEAPKIGPHRDAIRETVARIAGLSMDRVAVKATTSEQLGFTGRREGIAAYATATVRLPWSEKA